MTSRLNLLYTYQSDFRRRKEFLCFSSAAVHHRKFIKVRHLQFQSFFPPVSKPCGTYNANRQNDDALGIEIGSFSSNIPFCFLCITVLMQTEKMRILLKTTIDINSQWKNSFTLPFAYNYFPCTNETTKIKFNYSDRNYIIRNTSIYLV